MWKIIGEVTQLVENAPETGAEPINTGPSQHVVPVGTESDLRTKATRANRQQLEAERKELEGLLVEVEARRNESREAFDTPAHRFALLLGVPPDAPDFCPRGPRDKITGRLAQTADKVRRLPCTSQSASSESARTRAHARARDPEMRARDAAAHAAGRHPPTAIAILRGWLFDHFLFAYPTEEEIEALAEAAGLQPKQVKDWLNLERTRKYLPMLREIYEEEKEKEALGGGRIAPDQEPDSTSGSRLRLE